MDRNSGNNPSGSGQGRGRGHKNANGISSPSGSSAVPQVAF